MTEKNAVRSKEDIWPTASSLDRGCDNSDGPVLVRKSRYVWDA
jgi:hypothetical protein